MLDDKQREALFVEVHREIEAAAVRAAEAISGVNAVPELSYPPNARLSPSELASLSAGQRGPDAVAALRKVITDAAAAPLFAFRSLLDGVADPIAFEGSWKPFHLAPATDVEFEQLMLHDVFYDTYWLWRDRRPDPGWSLDTLTDKPPGDNEPAG